MNQKPGNSFIVSKSLKKFRLVPCLTVLPITLFCVACSNLAHSQKTISSYKDTNSVKSLSNSVKERQDPSLTSKQENARQQIREAFESLDEYLDFRTPEDKKKWFKLRVQGDMARNAGNHQQAIDNYTQALSIQPEHKTYFNRAISFSELNKSENALSDYEKSLELQPDFYEGWYNRGKLLNRMGRYEEAISSYEKVLSLQPDFFLAWGGLGYSQNCMNRYGDALLSNEKVLSINSNLHQAWSAHALSLVGLGRNKDAAFSLQKALEIDPDNQAYKRNLEVVRNHVNTKIQIPPCSLTISD